MTIYGSLRNADVPCWWIDIPRKHLIFPFYFYGCTCMHAHMYMNMCVQKCMPMNVTIVIFSSTEQKPTSLQSLFTDSFFSPLATLLFGIHCRQGKNEKNNEEETSFCNVNFYLSENGRLSDYKVIGGMCVLARLLCRCAAPLYHTGRHVMHFVPFFDTVELLLNMTLAKYLHCKGYFTLCNK